MREPLILSRGPLPKGYVLSHLYMISGHCIQVEGSLDELLDIKRHLSKSHYIGNRCLSATSVAQDLGIQPEEHCAGLHTPARHHRNSLASL